MTLYTDLSLYGESLRTALELHGFRTSVQRPDQPRAGHGRPARAATRLEVVVVDLESATQASALQLVSSMSTLGRSVIVVTSSAERTTWADCLERGAMGVLSKHDPLASVVAAVSTAASGQPVMPASERRSLLEDRRSREIRTTELAGRFASLTQHEQMVLARLVRGYGPHEVGDLGLGSVAEAGGEIRSLLHKLGVITWREAVSLANQFDWTPMPTRGD